MNNKEKNYGNVASIKVVVSYEEALGLVKVEIAKIKKERKLNKWCEEKQINYHSLISLVNGKNERPQPNKVFEVLSKLGYASVQLEKHYSYTFDVEKLK